MTAIAAAPSRFPDPLEPGGPIRREHLVARLMGRPDAALVLLTAPAGFGKTTLLRQWAAADPRPFTWLRVTSDHDDPLHLLRSIAAALKADSASATRWTARALLRQLAALLRDSTESFVLVLDDAHLLHNPETATVLNHLIESAGPNSQIAVASRAEPDLPFARLRAERRLCELNASDLIFTRAEVARVAAAEGLDLGQRGAELLARRTEGWPAAVYLAALTIADDPQPLRALARFGGGDRAIADYLSEEVLADVPEREMEFLVRTSIVKRLSGPLCDHLLQRRGSSRLLRDLSRRNPLVIPLDRSDAEYRYQSLLAEHLRAQLRLRDPSVEPGLHLRASVWYEQQGDVASAIEHAIQARDVDRAGTLIWSQIPAQLGYNDGTTVAARLGRFSHDEMASSATLAASAAMAHLAMGDRALAEHWAAVAARARRGGDDADPSLEVAGHLLQAAVVDGDVDAMIAEAARGYQLADADSPWRPLACLVDGMARQVTGDIDLARARLDEGSRKGAAMAPSVQVICLAQLALLAVHDNDWDSAALFAARARAQTDRVGLGDQPTVAIVFATSAAVHAHFDRLGACEQDTREATRLLAKLTDFTPWYKAECSIALSWAALRLGDLGGAQSLLNAAERELRGLPEENAGREWLHACRAQAELVAAARNSEGDPLTTAELRVLQFLPTHLSFPEIALELFVSTNTVKTHARAVYRKLAASCRTEAVTNARETGLLTESG